MKKASDLLPPMLTGEELDRKLTVLPEITINPQTDSVATRLTALSDIYNVYVCNTMSRETYYQFYLALLRSLQKKNSREAIAQHYENSKMMHGHYYTGLLGGVDSASLLGDSGIGKSTTISRVIEAIGGNTIIETDEPYSKMIPCLVVSTPFDASVKGLLYNILLQIDKCLGTNHYEQATKLRASTEMLVGLTSQILQTTTLLVCIDEIQHVVFHKKGRLLVNCLTNIINCSGVSMFFIGTPECRNFFEQAMQLARRSLGLQYEAMAYGEEFKRVCKVLYSYQYVKHRTEITDAMLTYLYEHSQGNVAVLVSLVHDAQQISMLNGREVLDIEALNEAYQKRLTMLHGYIKPKPKAKGTPRRAKTKGLEQRAELLEDIQCEFNVSTIIMKAQNEGRDIVEFAKQYIEVEEVRI